MKKEAEKFADSTLLEGMVSLSALFRAKEDGNNDRPIYTVYFAEEKRKTKERELAFLKRKQAVFQYQLQFLPLAELDAMAVGNTHGGILARCGERSFPTITEEVLPKHGFFVLLDGVEDPYNFGYALRSLYAAGADGILLAPRNWMNAAGVVSRASAGASELFPMYLAPSFEQAQKIFHTRGYRIAAADLKDACSVYEADLSLPLLLLIGGEKRGLSASVRALCDSVVRLDYGRDFPAALSAASAATVLGFEIFRRNR